MDELNAKLRNVDLILEQDIQNLKDKAEAEKRSLSKIIQIFKSKGYVASDSDDPSSSGKKRKLDSSNLGPNVSDATVTQANKTRTLPHVQVQGNYGNIEIRF